MKRKIKLTREGLQRLVTESVNEILSNQESVDNMPKYVDSEKLLNVRKSALNLYNTINNFADILDDMAEDYFRKTDEIEVVRGDDEDDGFTHSYLTLEEYFMDFKELAKKYRNASEELHDNFNSTRGILYNILQELPKLMNSVKDDLYF